MPIGYAHSGIIEGFHSHNSFDAPQATADAMNGGQDVSVYTPDSSEEEDTGDEDSDDEDTDNENTDNEDSNDNGFDDDDLSDDDSDVEDLDHESTGNRGEGSGPKSDALHASSSQVDTHIPPVTGFVGVLS